MALSEEQKAFAEWLALPKEMREPSSQKKFAELIGVTEMTLSRWKQRHAFTEYVDNTLVRRLRDHLGSLYQALINHAIDGKHPKYMEMALQLSMDQFGKKEVDVRITSEETVKMTTEDIADRMYGIFKKSGELGISKAGFRAAVAGQQNAVLN